LWVDLLYGRLHRSAATREPGEAWADETTPVGGVLGAVALRSDGGLVAATDKAFVLLDPAGKADADPVPIAPPAGARFNDGACDAVGRFLVGTTASGPQAADGLLWSLDPTGTASVVLDGLTEPNGLDWSPDGCTLYFIDSTEPVIRRYEYNQYKGTVGVRRADLARLETSEGVPDGLVVDSDGCVWIALWEGGALRRYTPEGELLLELPMPVSQPTCPCFAGPLLDCLIVTSGWEGMSPALRETEPWAGHLLWTRSPVRGRLPYRFRVEPLP
jgi:sugar lactone lactonase YvrE